MWINSELFRTEAKHFLKYGYYCDDPPGTINYKRYWEEQLQYCKEGFSVGGKRITGDHYAYLNFAQIKLTDEENVEFQVSKTRRKKAGKKITTFPDFWDGDYDYFWVVDIAENGIDESEYLKLGLEVKVLDLGGGKHVIVAKARRRGFSYKNGMKCANRYNHTRGAVSLIGAYETKYLYPKGTMTMATDYLNFFNEHTAWRKRRHVVDKVNHRRASYYQKIDGIDVEKGYKSEIIAVSFKDKADAARGKDASLVLFEEGGTFENLKEAFWATKPTVEDGEYVTGQIIIFGCVCEGTKVWTHNGKRINIEELNKQDGILGYSGNGVSKEPIVWMQSPSNKPCYRITVENGGFIECSDDHPLMVSRNHKSSKTKGKITTFKKAKDIVSGDQLMSIIQIPVFGNKSIWKPRLVGLLIGDGYYGKGSTPQVSTDSEGLDLWLNKELGGALTLNKETKTKLGNTYKYYSIKRSAKELELLGMYGQTWENKHLPDNIHECDMYSITELLGGYFDADGSVYHNKKKNWTRITLTSKYPHLLEEVKDLLLRLGIGCNIVKEYRKGGFKPGDIYRLYISKQKDLLNFTKLINLKSDKKRNLLEKYIKKPNARYEYPTCTFEVNPDNGKGGYYLCNKDKKLKGLTTHYVKSVEFIGIKPVYNLNAGLTHTYITNEFISGNTGGDMEKGTIDFESMFNDPETYDMIPLENIWDEYSEGMSCGFFFPVYKNKKGFIDPNGNSDKEEAYESEKAKREKLIRTSKDPKAIDLYVTEYPFNPREAFMQVSSNIFPVMELNLWRGRIKSDRALLGLAVHGDLVYTNTGVEFISNPNAKPITKLRPERGIDLSGCVTIYQSPYRDPNGHIPDGLYIVCNDPYGQDKSTGVSIGATYVIKRINAFSKPDDMIVASYIGRPSIQDMYNDNLFKLAEFYNAKIGFENDRGDVIGFAKRQKKTKWLMTEVELIDKKANLNMKRLGRVWGSSTSTPERKGQGNIFIRDWLTTPRGINEHGAQLFNFHYIYDDLLLEELIKYNDDGNFDRVSALRVGMYHIQDMFRREVKNAKAASYGEFWDRPLYGGDSNYNGFSNTLNQQNSGGFIF